MTTQLGNFAGAVLLVLMAQFTTSFAAWAGTDADAGQIPVVGSVHTGMSVGEATQILEDKHGFKCNHSWVSERRCTKSAEGISDEEITLGTAGESEADKVYLIWRDVDFDDVDTTNVDNGLEGRFSFYNKAREYNSLGCNLHGKSNSDFLNFVFDTQVSLQYFLFNEKFNSWQDVVNDPAFKDTVNQDCPAFVSIVTYRRDNNFLSYLEIVQFDPVVVDEYMRNRNANAPEKEKIEFDL